MKKKTEPHPASASAGDRVAGRIASGILWLQKHWAEAMSRQSEKLRPGSRKVILAVCCLSMLLYSSFLLASGFSGHTRLIAGPTSIRIPKGVILPQDTMRRAVTPGFMKPITKFHEYLDSLEHTTEGRHTRDSLLRKRPGLLDSIRHLEQLWCR
ncbi:hypothetical protein ACFJIV_29175 [Mucilaginibacter sp. UC70_90]